MSNHISVAERRAAMQEALRSYCDENGKEAALALMERIAGTAALSKVPEDKFDLVIAATKAAHKSGRTIGELDPTAIYAKWNAAKPPGSAS
jgi:hypothetical protein